MQEKPKYIFIHGLGGLGQSSSGWDKTIANLSSSEDILTPDLWDLLGNKEVTYDNVYRLFSQHCNKYNEPLNLCGLSLGGTLALNYVIDYPNKVSSLILSGTQYRIPKTMMRLQNFIFKLMPEKSFSGTGMSKKNIMKLTKSMMNIDFSYELKKISCPTLVICGSKDKANMKATNELSRHISQAKKAIIKNTGHELNVDSPNALADVINKFWF